MSPPFFDSITFLFLPIVIWVCEFPLKNQLAYQVVAMDGQQQPEVLATENRRLSDDYKGGRQMDPQTLAQAGVLSLPNFIGKHRMQAAISHLNDQIHIIQEELEELETIGESSTVCKIVISSVESIPDPLLPLTKGPAEAGWDRWFGGGSYNSRSHKRWI